MMVCKLCGVEHGPIEKMSNRALLVFHPEQFDSGIWGRLTDPRHIVTLADRTSDPIPRKFRLGYLSEVVPVLVESNGEMLVYTSVNSAANAHGRRVRTCLEGGRSRQMRVSYLKREVGEVSFGHNPGHHAQCPYEQTKKNTPEPAKNQVYFDF